MYANEALRHVAELPDVLETEMQVIRVGDAALVTLPGEVFVEIGLQIKAESLAPKTFVIGLANGFVGYVPTDHALKHKRRVRDVDVPVVTARRRGGRHLNANRPVVDRVALCGGRRTRGLHFLNCIATLWWC